MKSIARTRLPAALAAAVLAVGCGTGSDLGTTSPTTQTAGSAPDGGSTVHVVMKSLDFNPTAVTAKVGQRVTWRNDDNAPHNVTYFSGPRFKSSRPVMDPGTTFSLKLTRPGTIHYYCTIHPWMKATIVVSA